MRRVNHEDLVISPSDTVSLNIEWTIQQWTVRIKRIGYIHFHIIHPFYHSPVFHKQWLKVAIPFSSSQNVYKHKNNEKIIILDLK